MKLMKNPEVIKITLLFLVAGVAFSLAAFLFDTNAGFLMLGAWAFFLIVFLWFTGRRYNALAELSLSIDRILHGEQLSIAECKEGELSILSSELQKMLNRLKEQAEALQQDKITLSDAIADISHQLRTPLTSMNLTVSLLRKSELSPEKRITLLRELNKSLSRIEWLVEALLKISKIDAGTAVFRRDMVSVKELIEKACENLLIPMELKEQTLSVSVRDESFVGDFQWSSEAIGNIVKNCMEHTPVGGEIRIEAEETALYTQLIICDNGVGFAKADIPHLFERFYKGSNASAESVGIGLALSRMIIAAQNGVITAANHPKGGAMFTVRFYKGVI